MIPGIIGPSTVENEVELKLPSFIVPSGAEQQLELKVFVDSIVKAANKNCLKLFGELMDQQNKTIQDFVKKMGG